MDSEYYVNASRQRSISNNDENNNSWTYKLNDGLRLPAGTSVQVTNSFINKQGVTNESIEINEPISETFSVGFTVPQSSMFMVKPERSAKDDRLPTATLDDPEGSLGLQTAEISTVLTNYYDAMVQHNTVFCGGLNLFNASFSFESIGESGTGIFVSLDGDFEDFFKTGMPMVIRGLVVQNSLQIPEPDGRLNPINGYYMKIDSAVYNGTETLITTITGFDQFTSSAGYTNANYDLLSSDALTQPSINVPEIGRQSYSSMYGVAMINSLVGTKEGGGTMYEQTKLAKTEFAWENPDPVPILENQIDGINYQAGIDSQVIAEELRKQTANPLRDSVWNASQTSQESYDFSRGSYSFLFGPAASDFIAVNEKLDYVPYIENFDWEPQISRGLNGHSIRQNANNMMIGRTGDTPRMSWLDDGVDYKFFPYIDAPAHTEYPDKKYRSIPRPAQPAKFKDTFSSQVDYLRDGFSYDCSTSRVELFTAEDMAMENYTGAENPMQPNIYQVRVGQDITQTTLSTLPQATFLDRVVLSQTMVSGLMNRFDSRPYVKRSYTIDVMDISEDPKPFRVGKIISGSCVLLNQSAEIRSRLVPHRVFRNQLDSGTDTDQQELLATTLEVKFMIKAMSGEGTDDASITEVEALTNVEIDGCIFTDWNISFNDTISRYMGTDEADEITFSDVKNYGYGEYDQTQIQITVSSESFTNQSPQYVPLFSAKGCFSDLKGNTEYEKDGSDNDIDLGGGASCKFNYFADTLHNQTDLDYAKNVGEDFFLNPNIVDNRGEYIGTRYARVTSTPAFNMEASSAGLRENEASQKRIFIQQRSMASCQGIHPRRTFVNPPTTINGLTSFTNNLPNIPIANYLFGSTSHCSLGSMKPPVDKSFEQGQVVMNVPLVGPNNIPTPENNGLTSLSSDLQTFDPDASDNVLKLKLNENKGSVTSISLIRPLQDTYPAVTQTDPFGEKSNKCQANCASALGDYEGYPYSTPSVDMMDTGGTGDNLVLVQLQSLIDDLGYNYGDYVLRPLTSDINIEIPKGVYSINSFIDLFNDQIKDLETDSEDQMANIDNYKTIKKFEPLNGNALSGGQVTLLNDFLPGTHSRTVYSEDPENEFNTNPLVIAVSVQTYNDIVRAWQYCGGDADLVSYYMAVEDDFENCYYNTQAQKTVGGGSYVWKNFRDKYYWSEFVDKYSDNIQDLISDSETDGIENYDLQFLFATYRNGDGDFAVPNVYGNQTILGENTDPDPSLSSQFKIDGPTVPQIDSVRKYNSVKRGIYVGSPNFELTYDEDKKTFALDNLHYAFRNPTVDLTGESAFSSSSIGQPTILFRSLSELIQGDYEINGTSAELPSYVKNALEQPLDQISGVFIFNMAKTTSSSLGKFIDSSSSNIGRVFNDYFISEEKALEAWKSTFWYRLGFSYDTFNTRTQNDLASYYLNPVDSVVSTQESNFISDQVSYLVDQTSSSSVSVKYRPRQVLINDVSSNDNFNDVSRNIEDNYLPGVKTSSTFDIRSIPTIASLPGVLEGSQNELVRLYNNASISTIRSMSGGYVYHPMKLGSPDSFDITTNYTAQNIGSPNEGYIFQGPLQGNTVITSKGGAVVPEASQLLYQRSWQFLTAPIPAYVPPSYYSKTYSQPVDGDVYPVAYDFLNVAFQEPSPLKFSNRSQFNISNGVFRDRTFNLNGSMFLASQSTPITSQSNSIEAVKLPILTTEGHFIITSDLVKRKDSINGSDQIPILGIIPLSSLSSQDFITSFNDIIHILDQDTVINSIKIEILNPDLTPPFLEPNSSVIIKIVFPQLQGIPPQLEDPSELKKKIEKEKLVGV